MGHSDDNRHGILHINAARPDQLDFSLRHHRGDKGEDVEVVILPTKLDRLIHAASDPDKFRQVFEEVVPYDYPRTNMEVTRRIMLRIRPSVELPVVASSRLSTWLASIKQTLAGMRKADR